MGVLRLKISRWLVMNISFFFGEVNSNRGRLRSVVFFICYDHNFLIRF